METINVVYLTNILTHIHNMNIGDVFIRKGLEYILDKTFKEIGISPICRNVSRFADFDDADFDDLEWADIIVYAGMPQYNNLDDWSFYYDDEMWNDLNRIGKPILRLAGGAGYPSETWTPEQFSEYLRTSKHTLEILAKSMTNVKLTTTRDPLAQQFVHDCGYETTLLPCSGSFAALGYSEDETSREYNAICLTPIYLRNRDDCNILMEEFKQTKTYLEEEFKKPCKVICQVKSRDYEFLLKYFDEGDIIVRDSYDDLMKDYRKVDICVTSRLHCGLPMWGIGGRVIMIRVDTRATAVKSVGIPIINLSDYTLQAVQEVINTDGFSKTVPQNIVKKSVQFYVERIGSILDTMGKNPTV